MINLYLKDNRGDIRHWTIWYDDDELVIKHGLLRGAMQEKREHVEVKGKNTLKEQIMSRIASRCSKMRDKGYVSSVALAMKGKATNAAGLPKPMLAQPIKNADVSGTWYTQYKYDGHRCIAYKRGGIMHAYSRNGKPITTIPDILDRLHHRTEEGQFLDGELYIHGLSLQKIASLVKRKQFESRDLQYKMYDVMIDEPYGERLNLIEGNWPEMVAPTIHMGDYSKEALDAARALGYEGLIVRLDDRGYEDGKRSKSLIKIKKFEDDEFQVVGIHSSVDNWAILECRAKSGKPFNVSAPGSIRTREQILKDSHKYIGERVTVEYSNITKDGVPFHPVALRFRVDL